MAGASPYKEDTIVALATPHGKGALGIIRLSGPQAIGIANKSFSGKDLHKQPSHTVHFGKIARGSEIVDEVLVTLFKAPNSFTREDAVEISCHGSSFIIENIIKLMLEQGARLAQPGEFTRRAFMNGRFDLAQAEAVADLIAADNKAAHMSAFNQMRGGFSKKIQLLRQSLVNFASLIELELDFSEEDVEFAHRDQLRDLVEGILKEINPLIESFDLGNVIKNGVPTVIAGKPNSGKSTLLNTLLNEEKAIVSDIPGTTRDFIEDEIHIGDISFRFIDTAGIREARDKIEAIGVARTRQKMKEASLIIYMFDLTAETLEEINAEAEKLRLLGIPYLKVGNKIDRAEGEILKTLKQQHADMIFISASMETNMDVLKDRLLAAVHLDDFHTGDTIITNLRHYSSLTQTRTALHDVLNGLDTKATNDFLALDLRQALHYLGEITGEITTEDLLDNIFSKFCIGK